MLLLRATVLGRMGQADAALAVLDRMAAANATLGAVEWLEKGRLLDRMGRYEEAFAAFDAGRQRLREVSGQSYLQAHAQQLAARLKSFFIAKRLATLPRAGSAARMWRSRCSCSAFRARARRCWSRP